MLNQVQGSDYAYTSKGNVYKKSTTGKKIGAVAVPAMIASGATALHLTHNYYVNKLYNKPRMGGKELFKNTGKFLKQCFSIPLECFYKSKWKYGKSLAQLPAAVKVPVGIATAVGLGALIGHGFDKVAEIPAKIKANVTADKTEK